MDQKREHKVVTRCGSLVEMRIKRKDGSKKWYLLRFVDEHNHEMVSEKFVNYLRSHRKISEVEIAQLTSMRGIGISISKIYESFTAQLGGFNKVSFTKQDMYNEVRKQRELQGGDVNATIKFLEGNSWATAYIQGRFFVGIRITSRCESLHAKLGRCVDFLCDNEDELEFRSCYGTLFVELEKPEWSKFTREMFWRFHESLRRCVWVRIFESKVTDSCHVYRIKKYHRLNMTWVVAWEPVTNNFRCTCMWMESWRASMCVYPCCLCSARFRCTTR
ncbi:hypothetical protein Ahy_B06g084261 [Arachis hypogaea]|uniref:Uncharacterized protein n=1 Tax=Arachis hypogaea TaxID=3818 RepID=A0A444YRF7_ARAHY|nr:hypothetical protein Ahy_B06g084261 [Arachis hypogaea]